MMSDILTCPITLISVLVVIFTFAHSHPHCPSTCNKAACDNGVLSCSKPGLSHIPAMLPPKTDEVLLINQDFSRASELTYMNISNYGPPEFKIVKITIQQSNLIGIASETFSHLHHLQYLDLSFNRLQTISPRTFEALNLNYLRLDGNLNLKFLCSSFQKSIIRHLSLVNCSIITIDFCTLKPIIGVLKKLILSNNLLKTIDQKFEFLFQRLDEVRLNHNEFVCAGCQQKWLSKVLRTRFTKFNYSYFSDRNLGEIFPKCYSPSYLADSFIHRINDDEFVCNSPAIKSIDVIIDKFEKLTLACNSFSTNDKIIWIRNLDSRKILQQRTTIDIRHTAAYHQYYCMVSNRRGNVSTSVNINWPPLTDDVNMTVDSTAKIPTLSDSTFYSPRFSLLELIAAVVGTFTLFLIMFIIIIKYSFSQKDNKLFQYPNVIEKHCGPDVVNHPSLKRNNNYHDPEAIRYDWSGNTSFCNSQTYDIPVSTGSVFLDFKTHEEIQRS